MTLLWVTRAALDDLGYGAHAGQDLSPYQRRHPVLASFYSKRAQSVVGTQQLEGVPHQEGIWNLHAQDPHRAVTWYDAAEDVVFLLACSHHVYAVFVDRYRRGTLKPTEADYVDVATHRRNASGLDDDFIAVVESQEPDLVQRALEAPGRVIQEILGSELPVAALLEVAVIADVSMTGDVYLVLRFTDRLRARSLPSDVVADLASILLPDADYEDIDWTPTSAPDELSVRPGDTVIRWTRH